MPQGVTDPFETAQSVLFEQLRKAGAEKQRAERQAQETQSMHDYLREQVNNYNNGVDPTDNETGYGTEKTNRDVQDSMNEKLADKGISVDNVDTNHVSDETQDMTLANRPTTDDKVKDSMNGKLNDKGISVDNVNTNPVSNAESVTLDKTQSKTEKVGRDPMTAQENRILNKINSNESTSTSTGMKSPTSGAPSTSTGMNPPTSREPSTSSGMKSPTSGTLDANKMTTEPKKSATETNESIKSSMNDKLSDNGIKVGSVNSETVKGKEVNPVKNINPPKTEQKRFKDDSGYVTKVIPNKPAGRIKK